MNAAQQAVAIVLLAIATALSQRPVAAAATQPQLVDQRGQHFTLHDLRGEPVVVTFVSAHCTDICPLVNAMTADAVRRAESAHLRVRFLTVTLDPIHDSDASMRAIAQRFDADPREWLVARGSVDDVYAIMRAFGVVARQGQHFVEAHSTVFYILGPDGYTERTLLVSRDVSQSIIAAIRTTQNDASL